MTIFIEFSPSRVERQGLICGQSIYSKRSLDFAKKVLIIKPQEIDMNLIKQGEEGFEQLLDKLSKEYKGCAGSPETEVIANWNKIEVKEDKVVSFYASNKELASAIQRGRKAIKAISYYGPGAGATLYVDHKRVRPISTIIRPDR